MSMSLSWSCCWMALSTLKSQYSRFRLCRWPSASSASMPYAHACSTGSGSRLPVRVAPLVGDLLQRLAADVLHDDVAVERAGALVEMLDEVVDADDVGVLDLGEEAALGDRRGHRVLVAGVQQALEHHPPVGDRAVDRQIDPAQAAVGEAAHHLVLPVHDVAAGAASARTSTGGRTWCRTPPYAPAAHRANAPPAPRSRSASRTACARAPRGSPSPRYAGRGAAPPAP